MRATEAWTEECACQVSCYLKEQLEDQRKVEDQMAEVTCLGKTLCDVRVHGCNCNIQSCTVLV